MKGHTNYLTNTKLELCLVGGMIVLTIITGAITSSIHVNADDITDVTDTTAITVSASCSMTSTIDTAHTATIPNGIYSGTSLYPNGIGKTTIATFCNDNSGYAIYAIGFTGDSYTGADHTKLIGQATSEKIATGTATSGSTSNWAMKLVKESDSTKSYNPANLTITNGYDDYSAIPDTYTKVANYTSTTDKTLGSVLSTTYAAYISGTQVADTYVGKVKYTLVHPNTEPTPSYPIVTESGKICYYPNGSAVVGTMGCQSVSSSITLLASNFSRTGYGFAGWNTEFDYSGTFYGPNETISLNTADYSGTNPGLSLYAVWVKSVGNLQDSSKVAQLCGTNGTGGSLATAPIDGTANLSSVSALTDQRDNNTYAIARLADGKCWMIENLRLDNTNSDNSTGALAQGYGTSTTYGNFSGLADPESPWANNSTTANSLYYSGTQDGTASIDIGTTNYPGYRFPRYNNKNIASRADTITTNINNIYSYGNYYTWAAAIADTTHYNSTGNQSVTGTSICPSGWHLPIGGNISNEANNEFWAYIVTGLNSGTNPANYYDSTSPYSIPYYTGAREGSDASNKLRSYPNNFLYSGYVDNGSVVGRGSNGGYWSSTASSSSDHHAFKLGLYSTYVYPGTNFDVRYRGWTIRCLSSS